MSEPTYEDEERIDVDFDCKNFKDSLKHVHCEIKQRGFMWSRVLDLLIRKNSSDNRVCDGQGSIECQLEQLHDGIRKISDGISGYLAPGFTEVEPAGLPKSAQACFVSRRNGQSIVTASTDGHVTFYNAHSNESRQIQIQPRRPNSDMNDSKLQRVVQSPDDSLLVLLRQTATVVIYDAQTGECRQLLSGHDGIDPCHCRIHAAHGFSGLSAECHVHGHTQPVVCADFTCDSMKVATGGCDMAVRLWCTQTAEMMYRCVYLHVYKLVCSDMCRLRV